VWTLTRILFVSDDTIEPELILTSLGHPRGYFRTNITVGRPPLPGGWDTKDGKTIPGQHCLDYYAILYKDDDVFSSCLQIWPTWMYDLRYCNLYIFKKITNDDCISNNASKPFFCDVYAHLNVYQSGETFCKMFTNMFTQKDVEKIYFISTYVCSTYV